MKGITKELAFFIKIMELAFIIMGLLVIYFKIAKFLFDYTASSSHREIRLMGEILLSCGNLTEISYDGYPVKALFNSEKLDDYEDSIPPCMDYPRSFRMEISYNGNDYLIGNSSIDKTNAIQTSFPAAVKDNGEVVLTSMFLYVN